MDREKILDKLENKGFFHHNNYHIINRDEKELTIKVDLTEVANNPYDFAHGGLIFGLTDTIMGMLAATTGKKAVTINANISYLKPGEGSYLIAKGEILKNGSNICFLKSDVYNDQNELVATATGTYYYLEEKKEGLL